MIYEFPDDSEPIKQGDIFYPLPMTVLNLGNMTFLPENDDPKEMDWISLNKVEEEIIITTRVERFWGIVASQDCDVARDDPIKAPLISLFEIGPFKKITGLNFAKDKEFPFWITRQCHHNQKWFYLPPDERLGFGERMAINFQKVFPIRLSDLISNKCLRKGRLNPTADEHYRECIAQYYRRYPYDEWYPLNKSEFDIYNAKYNNEIPPFDYQK